jgi:flagellar basal-body rod protein FlgC
MAGPATSPGAPRSLFDVAGRAMSAQLVRMNAAASNLANSQSVAGSAEAAYRPVKAVFRTVRADADAALATVDVAAVMRAPLDPIKQHAPDHPLADAEGNVFAAPVDESTEMVEMLEGSRQYGNLVEMLETAKTLTLQTLRIGQ